MTRQPPSGDRPANGGKPELAPGKPQPCDRCSQPTPLRRRLFNGRICPLCQSCWKSSFTAEQRARIIAAAAPPTPRVAGPPRLSASGDERGRYIAEYRERRRTQCSGCERPLPALGPRELPRPRLCESCKAARRRSVPPRSATRARKAAPPTGATPSSPKTLWRPLVQQALPAQEPPKAPRPPKARKPKREQKPRSVWTVRGGAPGLGKRA